MRIGASAVSPLCGLGDRPPHKKLLPQQEHSRHPQPKNQPKPYGKHMQLKDNKIKTGG
jgi:hypothetical protein